MSRSHRKRSIIAAVIAVLVMAAGAAAYWSAGGGGGSGSATAGTTTALTVNQTTTVTPMYPGDTAQTLSGTFGNTNPGPIHVTSVTASISAVTPAGGAVGGCDSTDFTLANPIMSVNANVPAGTAQGAWTGATIQFNNKTSNQDGCKGATVTLSYVVA